MVMWIVTLEWGVEFVVGFGKNVEVNEVVAWWCG